jgi:hypothetical protein
MNRSFPLLVTAAAIAGLANDVPAPAPLGAYKPAERRHWSLKPRKPVKPPLFDDAAARAWIRTPVDGFILQRLRNEGLKPAPEADRITLIRRLSYDLHGLPPTPEEIDTFVNDKSPNAYENLVQRLLSSHRYGEQWGHHWLDVVRFAESDGYEYDTHRPDAYRFRDYVIASFNADKPYDQFIREQLAGDEADTPDDTLAVASGFNRLGPLRKNAGNQEVASSRTEVLTEMTNIVGAAFLGMTVGCARCHDHKFDPIRQADYYRMQGYFAQTQEHDIVVASPEEQAAWKAKVAPIDAEMTRLRRSMRRLPEEQKAKVVEQLEALDEKMPDPLTAMYAVRNDVKQMTPVHILARGDYRHKGSPVGMRPLGVLLEDNAPELPIDTAKPRGRLAAWIADPAHPLTARVMTNRVWQYHFGRGIVSTPNDFGRMGTRPSHPDLLDWLANQFVEGGWKIKPLHRMILMSSAYRQASSSPLEKLAAAKDPENALLWKFNRRRLEAGELRDSMLAISGRLNLQQGGRSIMTVIDPDLVKDLKRPQYWQPTRDKAEHDRRTIYMIYKRNLILPFMQVFDAPDTMFSCARRDQSTHAPQALEMMNGKLANSYAESLAKRLLAERTTLNGRIDRAWRLTAGRPPTPAEVSSAIRYLDDGPDKLEVLKEFALVVLNMNPFLYVN